MVSVLSSSVVDRGFEPRSGQTKDYKINICCFSTKHTALRSKNKDWLAQNHDSVSTLRSKNKDWLAQNQDSVSTLRSKNKDWLAQN